MVKLEKVSKSFENVKAIDDVSFEFPQSQITIIAGADGAGKSTLFKMLVGLVKRDTGDIVLNGTSIKNNYNKITSITGYMPERFSLYPDLSVEENLNFFADIHQLQISKREERKTNLLKKTGMIQFRKRRARNLSGGMKQKLSLASILLSAPKFIILDEPTTGVDPLSRIEFFNIISDLKEEGKTIAISTPYLDEAEQGDYIVFLKKGKVIKQDSIQNLKNQFPARIFKIMPQGNIFDVMRNLEAHKEIAGNFYIRGKYIKYLQTGSINQIDLIPNTNVEEEEPKLEDIYLYYERQEALGAKQNG